MKNGKGWTCEGYKIDDSTYSSAGKNSAALAISVRIFSGSRFSCSSLKLFIAIIYCFCYTPAV